MMITEDTPHIFMALIFHSVPRDYCTVCGLPERAACHLAVWTRNVVNFTLPFCPPSVNSLYSVNFKEPDPSRRISLKDECRQWADRATSYVPRFGIAENSAVRIDWTVYYPFLTKRKTWVRRDTSNMLKLLHDMIAKRINVDDRRFKSGMMQSVNSDAEKTEVTLIEIPISEWSK